MSEREALSEEERIYGTPWSEVSVQLRRQGSRYVLGINRMLPDGEQVDFTIKISPAQAEEFRPLWFPHD